MRAGDIGENDAVSSSRLREDRSRLKEESSIDGKVLEAIRMVLSGVARTEKMSFSCGRNLIAQMLCGSGSAKMKKLGLNRLSTFGLLKHLKQDEVGMMIDALVKKKCLQQVDVERNRPVLELTEFGAEVMRGQMLLRGPFSLPREVLLKLRFGQPEDSASAPISKSSKQQYSKSFSSSPSPVALPPSVIPSSPPPSHYWTRRLLSAGFSVDECMAIRGLSREAVLEHARLAEEEE